MSNAAPVSDDLRDTLRWVTASVRDVYASRLQRLILFGSHARGDATTESDVDVLVVLEGPIRVYEEAKRTSRIATQAAAYRDTALSFVHVSANRFADDQRPFVQSVREEGVDLLELFPEDSSAMSASSKPPSIKPLSADGALETESEESNR